MVSEELLLLIEWVAAKVKCPLPPLLEEIG